MQITQKNFYKKLLGRVGENKAVEYLKKQGYTVLEKNYKTRLGEIDVIVKKDETIIFVEVKTRTSDTYGRPSEAVGYEKQRKYVKVAQEYLLKNKLLGQKCRFDVIEILNEEINHIIDAFCV